MKIRFTSRPYTGVAQALLVFVMLAGGLFLLALPAQAKTFLVNTSEDFVDKTPGDGTCAASTVAGDRCSLRAAIQEANAFTGPDEIDLPPGHYTLTITGTNEDAAATGDLDITDTLMISGSGAFGAIIRGGTKWDDRIFEVRPGSVAIISGVTISGGNPLDEPGAGILVDGEDGDLSGGQLTLSECRVTNNHGTASGGGINSSGILTVTNCTVDDNRVVGDSAAAGGGIYVNTDSTIYMVNSTVAKNTAQDEGGGIDIANDAKPPSTLNNVTLVHNTLVETDSELAQGAGIAIGNGVLTVTNSILAANLTGGGAGSDCHGGIQAVRYSLIEAPAPDCFRNITDTPGVLTGTAPLLGAFSIHDSKMPLYSLQNNSPAINAGNPAPKNPALDPESCFANDQRGAARVDRCDMGAFELIQVQQPVSTTLYMPDLSRH